MPPYAYEAAIVLLTLLVRELLPHLVRYFRKP